MPGYCYPCRRADRSSAQEASRSLLGLWNHDRRSWSLISFYDPGQVPPGVQLTARTLGFRFPWHSDVRHSTS